MQNRLLQLPQRLSIYGLAVADKLKRVGVVVVCAWEGGEDEEIRVVDSYVVRYPSKN